MCQRLEETVRRSSCWRLRHSWAPRQTVYYTISSTYFSQPLQLTIYLTTQTVVGIYTSRFRSSTVKTHDMKIFDVLKATRASSSNMSDFWSDVPYFPDKVFFSKKIINQSLHPVFCTICLFYLYSLVNLSTVVNTDWFWPASNFIQSLWNCVG